MSSEAPKGPVHGQDASTVPAWQPPRLETQPLVGASPQLEKILSDARGKIVPRAVKGHFDRIRNALIWITQILFFGLPWLQWNDRQAVLFDLGARKFYLFGMVLWPQDIIYLAVLLIISAYALFLFTAIAGRLFCGYACPQSVYTKIMMWFEQKIEGDRVARIRLNESPWTLRKFRIKFTKHAVWVLFSLWTGLTFIGYFAPIRELPSEIIHFNLGPWQWVWFLLYSAATLSFAGFLRESICRYACPYARFQSVMVDEDTFVVSYDYVRGEPRGPRSKKVDHKAEGKGDCINCSLCVQVCPTGIDIREGLQYMCIGCGACVDACNEVMDKMGYERDLIRYTSGRAISERLTQDQARKRMFRPRVLIYISLLVIVSLALVWSMAMRDTLKMNIIRDRGLLGREVAGGLIENVYRLQLVNATEEPLTIQVSADGIAGIKIMRADNGRDTLVLPASSTEMVPVVVQIPYESGLSSGMHEIQIRADAIEGQSRSAHAEDSSNFYIPQ